MSAPSSHTIGRDGDGIVVHVLPLVVVATEVLANDPRPIVRDPGALSLLDEHNAFALVCGILRRGKMTYDLAMAFSRYCPHDSVSRVIGQLDLTAGILPYGRTLMK